MALAYLQTLDLAARPAKDKHSSLLQTVVNYGRKKCVLGCWSVNMNKPIDTYAGK